MAERTDLAINKTEPLEGEDRSAREIRQDIAAKRESITKTVEQINDKVQSSLDWRTYAGQYPFITLGVAVGAGFLVTRLFRPKPTPKDRILDAIAESFEDVADRFGGYLEAVPEKKSGASTAIKSAAAAWLTKAASDYLKDRFFPSTSRNVDTDPEAQARAQRASA